MGAKTWMLVRSSGNARDILSAAPQLDRDATARLAVDLFPKERLELIAEDGDLSFTSPPDDELHIGCFAGLAVIAAKEFGIDHPSRLDARFLRGPDSASVYLHAMHSVVDWLAFSVWQEGALVRSLSLSPDSGVLEDIGVRLPFELPYWDGEHPAVDPDDEQDGEPAYPFPFHPLELGEAVLYEFFGYGLEGPRSLFEPEEVPLMRYRRKARRFQWWR